MVAEIGVMACPVRAEEDESEGAQHEHPGFVTCTGSRASVPDEQNAGPPESSSMLVDTRLICTFSVYI